MRGLRRLEPCSPSRLVLALALASAHAGTAQARARGIAVDSCSGCHGGGGVEPPALSLTAEPASFNPGDLVTFTLDLRWASMQVGGVYISSGGVGMLQPLPGERLALSGKGLLHTEAVRATGGAVPFRFAWRAPSTPGAVAFDVAAVAGNGNDTSSGDSPGAANFQWVFGCPGRTHFLDLDRDGYGAKRLGVRLACTDSPPPTGFAAEDGDCDENDEKAHPGATEVCNKKDDDCDGEVDEGAPPVQMWPDADEDGFYERQSGTAKTGCGNVRGYAAVGGDCDDLDPAISPSSAEVCNNRDDDCDGDVDEQVRPRCGVGWCSRYSSSCNPADCEPGPPAPETCNSFDDDCDGVSDDDACSEGFFCSKSACVSDEAGSPGLAPPAPVTAPARGSDGASGCSTRAGSPPRISPQWLATMLVLGATALSLRGRMSTTGAAGLARLRRPGRG